MSEQSLDSLRHSCAHLLAAAVNELYPDTLNTIGPAIDKGYYYDFQFTQTPKLEEMDTIESKMHEIVASWKGFEKIVLTPDQAREEFKKNPFKLELIEEIISKNEEITVYQSGEFRDLCRGGHVQNPAQELKYFKLLNISGAYWRGNEKNAQLTRIYGTAFASQEELDKHLWQLEEAKKRDHRKLGKELELFTFSEHIGQGLPIWLPQGNIIKECLENWAKQTEEKWGYQRVTTPVITKSTLFEKSGHLPLYADSMYKPMDIDGEDYYLKPMNCPFHHTIFGHRLRSYKELPLRIAEYGLCHRYEDSGSLFGLMRVRSMDMNDAHIYCTKESAIEEFIQVIELHKYYYEILGIVDYRMELSLRDPANTKYHGSEEMWQEAEKMTKTAMEKSGVPYDVVNEGAAFYGPKMDFQITSSIGREFTASTNQLDLYMPEKFNLEYVAKDGSRQRPVCIHRAPLGTHERFIGFLLEHFGGNLPAWLQPSQLSIITINDSVVDYANEIAEKAKCVGIRVEMLTQKEPLGAKISQASAKKSPYIAIIGNNEKENRQISVKLRDGREEKGVNVEVFLEKITKAISEKSLQEW